MKTNVGKTDRNLRLLIGVGLIATGAFMGSWWGLIGIIPIATATIRWCPAYEPMGLNTCESEADKPH